MTLVQPWQKLLLVLHIAASVGVLGSDLALLALGVAGVGGADPLTIYPAARLIGTWIVAPLALAALVTGLALGLLTRWGLFTYWWVTIKLAIVIVLTVAVLFVLVPSLAATADAVTVGSTELATSARLPFLVAPAVASTLLVVAIVLAVFKPSWRVRPSVNGAVQEKARDRS